MSGGATSGRILKFILVLAFLACGFWAGLNLSEEKKQRVKKLFSEAREIPFRLFV